MIVAIWQLYWQVRNCKKTKIWRQRVFERDNGTCQKCGRTETRSSRSEGYVGTIRRPTDGAPVIINDNRPRKRLTPHVHHKKSLGLLLVLYKIKTLEQALKCRPLWDIRNGITLCFDCHAQSNDKRSDVVMCKDCNKKFVGNGSILIHQSQTGHKHSKKLGSIFDIPREERPAIIQYFY
jgi:hypothetical protein